MKIKLLDSNTSKELINYTIPCRIMHFRNRDDKGRIMANGGATMISIIILVGFKVFNELVY